MNYLKVYCNLIRKAENRTSPDSFVERHHIFPKSIFGDNDRVVVLSPREHYVAHLLLEKIYIKRYGISDEKTRKMTFTCIMMKNRSEKYNSHLYEQVRGRYIKNMKKIMLGENNPNYGVPCSEERKEKIRKKSLGRKASQETKDKMSKVRKGKSHPRHKKSFMKVDDLEFRENFTEIVETSYSKKEVKQKMGHKTYGTITKWIKYLNLDTSHFTGKIGLCAISQKERVENGKVGGKSVSSQRWMCLETGFITNAGNLTQYQRKRNIDTSKRKRIG
jgi:hypothetical protein